MLTKKEWNMVRALHQKKTRYEERLILVEGPNAVEQALAAGLDGRLLCRSEEIPSLAGCVDPGIIRDCTEEEMKRLSTTKTGYAVCALFAMPDEKKRVPPGDLLYLDHIQDPGNAGTLVRSALSFGFAAVLFSPGSVDPFSPKVIRSSAGFLFSLPLFQAPETVEKALDGGRQLLLAEKNGAPMAHFTDTREIILCIGNEGHGFSSDLRQRAEGSCAVLMESHVESLNAAVAGSILMAERYQAGRGKL
ncbi:MAG TPA: RNA methyltransferase [Candidatus Mcinerneyibacteriales bacterium]|nr:RNA methyltransferase [Candidatus Mcinerneyibacteriales bacterium]